MIVIFTINLGWVIVTEAALGFLGLGLPPDVATWGGMLSWEGRRYMETEPLKETAWKAFHLAQEFTPDLFVGLGGGSCMDVGKVAWLLFEHPDLADLPLSESVQETRNRELRKKVARKRGTWPSPPPAAAVRRVRLGL